MMDGSGVIGVSVVVERDIGSSFQPMKYVSLIEDYEDDRLLIY